MTTANDIITGALQDLGAIAIDEVPSATEAANALIYLNRMIDGWQTEQFMVYSQQINVFPFVANQASYTCGPGGNFNMTRPVKIERAYARNAGNNDYSLTILNAQGYADIITKTVNTQLPLAMYDDQMYPLKNLYFYPVPTDTSYSVVLWSWQTLQSFSALNTVESLPPGYDECLEYNLAIRLAPKYNIPVSNDIKEQAVMSKAKIKRVNTWINSLQFDPVITERGNRFNYLTGRGG